MKFLRSVGAVGIAGIGSVAHAITICEYSVLKSSDVACINEEIQVGALPNDRILDGFASRSSGVHTGLDLVFSESSDPIMFMDWASLGLSEQIHPGLEDGCDHYLTTCDALKSTLMDVIFVSCIDMETLHTCLGPEYVRMAYRDRGIDHKFYTVANMITWTTAIMLTSLRSPT